MEISHVTVTGGKGRERVVLSLVKEWQGSGRLRRSSEWTSDRAGAAVLRDSQEGGRFSKLSQTVGEIDAPDGLDPTPSLPVPAKDVCAAAFLCGCAQLMCTAQ